MVHEVDPSEEYVPAEHWEGGKAEEAHAEPAGQLVHCDSPDWGATVPTAQEEHTVALTAEAKVPGVHADGCRNPLELQKKPMGHARQPRAPTSDEYQPTGHSEQGLAEATHAVPAGHFVHPNEALRSAMEPAGHAAQKTDPMVAAYVPAKHGEHCREAPPSW